MKQKRFCVVGALVFVVALTCWFYSGPIGQNVQAQQPAFVAERSARHQIEAAWGAARESGYYRYTSKMTQTTWPALRLENAGLSPKTDHIYLEGETNLPDEYLHLKLWADDGSPMVGQPQHEIKLEDGQSWVRSGENWLPQEQTISDLFAPGSDPLAYLVAADNVSENGEEIRVLPFVEDGKLVYTRYGFDLNGPSFAMYMREHLEEALRQSGELPPGISLDTAEIYRLMTGTGELLVGANGLPKRLRLDITFPPQDLDRVTVTITTDFNFPQSIAGHPAGDSPLLGVAANFLGGLASPKGEPVLGMLVALVVVLGFVAILIRYSHSKKLYATLAITLILSMVGTPLLQSQQVFAFSQKQADAQAQRAAEQQEQQAQAEADVALAAEKFDPHANPLASGQPSALSRNLFAENQAADVDDTDTDGDWLWDVDEITLSLDPNNPDTDGDGLSDGVEMLELGTSPYLADSDEDGLLDSVEVNGFYFDGTKYYTDPNNADTNGDGRLDMLEATVITGTISAYDSDGDQTPDLFDFDDDDDGVPDRVDMAPTEVITGLNPSETSFIQQTEFNFQLAGLTPNKPTFVDFQIRPYNAAHLGYAFNVLDWPEIDLKGQITRLNDTTFGTAGKDANGDMRLVPYLEITIPYDAARQRYGLLPLKPGVSKATQTQTVSNWLDVDETEGLGIAVRCANSACNSVIAEVPLTVVYDRDEDGQPMNPVAFGGRMFYRTDLAGHNAEQKMRLVWHIFGLMDVCEKDCYDKNTGSLLRENWHETTTLFQNYYDDFAVTGLNVVEDHGLQAGVLFENPQSIISAPDYDPNTYYGVNTWDLSLGLGGFFISRFQDACGRNMNDLDDISAALLNTTQAVQDCWDVNGDFEMLRYNYAHRAGLGKLALEDSKDILETHFLDSNGEPYLANPTLVYLLRETNRVASLDSDENVKPLSDGVYQISLAGKPNVTLTMNWATYEHNANSGWGAVDLQTYLGELEENLRAVLNAEDAFSGYVEESIVFAVSYYIRMYVGVSEFSVVQGALIEEPEKLKLKFKTTKFGKKVTGVLKFYQGLQADAKELEEFLKDPSLEAEIKRSKAFDSSWDKAKLIFGTILTAISVVQGAIEIYKLTIPFIKYLVCQGYEHLCPAGFSRVLEVTDYVIKAVSLALKAISLVIKIITKVVDLVFKIAKQGLDALIQISKTAGKTIAFGLLGLGISTGLSIGLLLATMFISGDYVKWDAWVKGVSSIAASVAIGVVLLILTLIPYINIIVIIIGLIDLLISTMCFAVDTISSELSKDNPNHGTLNDVNTALQSTICPGIMGWATALIIPYSDQAMVDFNQEDRLDIGNFDIKITGQDGTIREGDFVAVYADVTVGVYNTVPTGAAALYSLRYEPWDAFGNATFWYKLQDDKSEWDAKYGAMIDQWQRLGPLGGLYYPIVTGRRMEQTSHLNYYTTFSGAGINKQLVPKFYLAESWAVPVLKCVLTVCWDVAKYDMAFYPFDLPRYDIFPTTLDGFYELKHVSHSSYRLAWDYLFPTLKDADGDGLRARYVGGNDPDDKYIDIDNDWLADFYEIRFGSNPRLADSDGDTLSDYLEALYGTHPRRADTDSDGLTDWEELQGWEIVYGFDADGAPLVTQVQSDPLRRDTDGDSLSDKIEQKYGLNPQVYSNPNIIGITPELSDTDGYVLPGATVYYTTTLENNLKGRYAFGRYEADPASPLQGGDLNEGYILDPLETTTYFGNTTVPAGLAQSGPISITHWAGAQLIDQREERNGRIAVLHLDENVKAGARNVVYLDSLLNGNNGQCWSTYCPPTYNGGISGRAAYFSNDQIRVQMAVPQDEYAMSFLFRTDEKDMGLLSVDPAGESDLTMYLNADGHICAQLKTDTICGQNRNYADNDWHHVVHTYLSDAGGTQHWLFVDGDLQEQGNTTTLTGATPAYVDIGYSRHGVAADSTFSGMIDEVEIFDQVLSAADVQEMTTAFAGGENGPIMELPFEDHYPYIVSADTSLHGAFAFCLSPNDCPSTVVGVGGFGADTARDFDGNDDSMILHLLGQVQDEFTITFWFKTSQVAGQADDWLNGALMFSSSSIFGVDFGISLGDGYLMFGVGDKTISHPVKLADNQWHHVAATFDQDGHLNLIVQDPNPTQINGPITNFVGTPLGILGQSNSGAIAYDGLIDNFQIYDRVLSRTEIDDLALGVRRIETRFDEPPESTTFVDSTGNGYTGMCDYAAAGCPDPGFAGPFRGAAYFDGANDFIWLQNSKGDSTFIGDYSLSLWFWPEAPGGTILSKGTDSQTIRLSLDAAGKVHLDREADPAANSASLVSTGTVTWNTWNHVVVVYDRQNMALYLNGAASGVAASQSAVRDDTAPVLIGAEYANGTPTNFFAGYLDEVWVYERPLRPEQALRLWEKGPVAWLPLDEESGANSFANLADAANPATCSSDYPPSAPCSCPDSGLPGQFRQGVQFERIYAHQECLEIPHDNTASPEGNFTIGGWFKPAKSNLQQILFHKTDTVEVSIANNSLKVSVGIPRSDASTYAFITSQGELTPNEWNHVMVTLDDDNGKRFAIYINGVLDSVSTSVWAALLNKIQNNNPVYFGARYPQPTFTHSIVDYRAYAGPADDVVIYNKGLSAAEIKARYDDQYARYNTQVAQQIIVDADNPTVWLDLPIDYIRPITTVLSAGAADQTMEVTKVEYRLDGGAWQPATQDGESWLFYFVPSGQAQQTIDLRATDTLGHIGTASRTLTIDDTPPEVNLDTANLMCDPTFCMLDMSGDVTDNASGIEAVYVDVIEPGGLSLVIGDMHAAFVNGTRWQHFLEPMLYPSSDTFTVHLTAIDKVGNRVEATGTGQNTSNQITQASHTLQVDIDPPVADLTDMGAATEALSGVGAARPVITGTVTDIPYPMGALLHLHFEEPLGADRFHDGAGNFGIGTCSGASCPTAGAPGKYGRSLTFDGGDFIDLGRQPVMDGAADNFAAMAWIYLTDTRGVKTILGADTANSADGFAFNVEEDGLSVEFYGVHAYQSTQISLPTNEWVHVAAVMDHAADGSAYAVLFYVNGELVDNAIHEAPPMLNADDPIRVGAGFVGALDEVVLFNIVPTPAMIKDIAQPVSLGVDSLEIGLLHLKDWGDMDKVTWAAATLAAPGETFSTWKYTLPADLEGEYQMYLRATDKMPRPNLLPIVWQGLIDTQAPRAELRYTPPRFPGDGHLLQCWAADFNLTEQGYDCPVPGSLPAYYDQAWYTAVIPTPRLYEFGSPATPLQAFNPTETLTVFDRFGAQTTVTATISAANWPLGVSIFTPTAQIAVAPLQPVEIAGAAYAQAALKALTLTANGVPVHTENWGTGAATEATWATIFTPTLEGRYVLLAELEDWAGGVITSSAPVAGMAPPETIIYADAADPAIAITTTQITAENFDIHGFVEVSGLLTETNEVRSLQVKLDTPTYTGPWETVLLTDTTGLVAEPWRARLYAGGWQPPAGSTYTLTARVTDVAGKTAETSRTLFADAQPPDGFDLMLAYDDGTGALHPLAAWDTVRSPLNPTLVVTWTASADAAGLAPYRVEWLAYAADTAQVVAQEDVSSPLRASFTAAEAQKYTVRITARDTYGNQTSRTFGPIIVDYEETPVYIGLDGAGQLPDPLYRAWTATACNQIGTDGRIAAHSLPGATLGGDQHLYTAWDANGLHIGWQGANWDTDGDLFIYLDTAPGGSVRAYDPFTAAAPDTYLPAYPDGATTNRMAADYLVWAKTITDTVLLRWDGANWIESAASWDFAYQTGDSYTDIYLPFSTLGNPATLSLVALATEADTLRIWAALPVENPLTSAKVVNNLPDASRTFQLTHRYTWDDLGSGVCPSDRQVEGFPALDVTLTANPAMLTYSLLGDDLPDSAADALTALSGWDAITTPACLANPADPACARAIETGARLLYDQQYALAHLLGVNPPVVGPGETISYTLQLTNNGTEPLANVVAQIDTWGPIRLTGGVYRSDAVGESDTLAMPPVTLAASETVTFTFTSEIDLNFDPTNQNGWATLDVVVLDGTGTTSPDANGRDNYTFPLAWLYVDHEVSTGPSYLEFDPGTGLLGPGVNDLSGVAFDEVAIPAITLDVEYPAGNHIAVNCPAERPDDPQWACSLDLSGAVDGAAVGLSGRATNAYGQTSSWFESLPWVVDAAPPTITLSSATLAAFSDGYLNAAELSWSGTAGDNRLLAAVEICDPGVTPESCVAGALNATNAIPANPIHNFVDASAQPIGACGTPTVIPFVITETMTVLDLNLGLNLTHPARDELEIVLVSPAGPTATLSAATVHSTDFDLWLDDATAQTVARDVYTHDVAAPYYDNVRRPADLLYTFRGQPALGTWELQLCDTNPAENAGTYHRSYLQITAAQLPAQASGHWSYQLPGSPVDGEALTRWLYAVDSVGNRAAPLKVTASLDTVSPVVTVTLTSAVSKTITIAGAAADGSGIKALRLNIFSPAGNRETHQLTLSNGQWLFSGMPTVDGAPDGIYNLFVEAEDKAGNITQSGPYAVEIPGSARVLSVSPQNGAGTVAIDTPIKIWFNGAMQTDSLTVAITPTATLTPTWDTLQMYVSYAHTLLTPGTVYTVTLHDGLGLDDSPLTNTPYTWHFTTTVNIPPVVDAGLPQTGLEGSPIAFDGNFSTSGAAAAIRWDFGDGFSAAGTLTPTHTYDDNGIFTVTLTVTDTYGDAGADTLAVTVTNVAPAVNVVGADRQIVAGQPLDFTGTFTDPGADDTHTLLWDFGDGVTTTGTLTPTHRYSPAGIYTATLTVTDDDGGMDADTLQVEVAQAQVFLPLIFNNYSNLPDLVSSMQLIPSQTNFVAGEPVSVVVTVTNQGNTTAGAFWVDFYINPKKPPTEPNLPWDLNCAMVTCNGIVWSVMELAPGESVVLTSMPDSYEVDYTRWNGYFIVGVTEVYVFADSWNPGFTYGAVQESNEANNRAEILGLVVTRTTTSQSSDLPHNIEIK